MKDHSGGQAEGHHKHQENDWTCNLQHKIGKHRARCANGVGSTAGRGVVPAGVSRVVRCNCQNHRQRQQGQNGSQKLPRAPAQKTFQFRHLLPDSEFGHTLDVVVLDGGKPAEGFPFESVVEIEPRVVELSPMYFQRRTRDLAGRILLRSEELGDGEDAIEASILLRGKWPGDVELACSGELYSGLPSKVVVHGAGADPMNTSFRGALFSALSQGETSGETIDMSDRALEGRIDFTVLSELIPSSELEPENLYRVYLRDNVLENASLRLEDLHGVLEQRGTILSSPTINAALAGHPLHHKVQAHQISQIYRYLEELCQEVEGQLAVQGLLLVVQAARVGQVLRTAVLGQGQWHPWRPD